MKIQSIFDKAVDAWRYCSTGVWNDPSGSFRTRLIKTLNLSVNSFLDRDLQIKSMSLTYSTVLAIVPAIALLVAIGRGFGLQNSLQDELYNFFPSQHTAISTALQFVDSYLTSATSGVFVGVGIIVLLWTLISLLSSIEDAFNAIWDVKQGRSVWQKVTDYIAICLMIPILMICSSGLSIFMATTIRDNITLPFLTPVINAVLETTPFLLSWFAFTLSFFLIPNIRVKFRYAAISGAFCTLAFQLLQYLFVSGQIYVSKYNAIYGSFAFLPLLLIWLQLSWLLLLSGCVLCYSLQNVFTFNFLGNSSLISDNARHAISLVVMGVVAQRFLRGEQPLTPFQIASHYNLPVRVVGREIEMFDRADLIYFVKLKNGLTGIIPAMDVEHFTVGDLFARLNSTGDNSYIPNFQSDYSELMSLLAPKSKQVREIYSTLLVKDLPIPSQN